MRKLFLLITFFTLSIFSFSQDIVGKWSFDYILADSAETGENLKPISEGDFMQINEDGSFNYTLAAIPLKASVFFDSSQLPSARNGILLNSYLKVPSSLICMKSPSEIGFKFSPVSTESARM